MTEGEIVQGGMPTLAWACLHERTKGEAWMIPKTQAALTVLGAPIASWMADFLQCRRSHEPSITVVGAEPHGPGLDRLGPLHRRS